MRRLFLLVLALVGSAWAQGRSAQSPPRPLTPMVDIDVDPSPPISATSAIDGQRSRVPDRAFVSISDLSVPARARKEFEKAKQSLAQRNWTQARDRLNKAISFYPAYAGAYNDLGVTYAHLGDVDQERRALEKAIALDDHFALAHLNFGRMDIAEGRLPEAETALKKAAILAPQNPGALIVLSYCIP